MPSCGKVEAGPLASNFAPGVPAIARQFITVDYAAMLKQTVTLEECLPADHLARFIVDIIAQLDLSALYARYAARGRCSLCA